MALDDFFEDEEEWYLVFPVRNYSDNTMWPLNGRFFQLNQPNSVK